MGENFDIWQIFWIVIILMAFQPVLQRHVLRRLRQSKIKSFEKQRGSRLILLVHRQEAMKLFGFPIMRFIDIQDSEEIIRAIHMTDDETPIDIMVHTPGGIALAAVQVARAIRQHPSRVSVFIPHYAMSGGTLMALAADEIVMCEHSVLGPIDPQINQLPAASILKVLDQKPMKEIDDETLIMADVAKKALDQVETTAKELLTKSLSEADAARVAEKLSQGTFTHDYPISADEARAMGLNISTDMPNALLEMMRYYPQPVRGQDSVDYVPSRRGPGDDNRSQKRMPLP